jgi:hypothetical protein
MVDIIYFVVKIKACLFDTCPVNVAANLQESPEYVTSLPFWGQLPLKKLKKLVKNNKETYPSLLRANTFDISGEWADFQFYANKGTRLFVHSRRYLRVFTLFCY